MMRSFARTQRGLTLIELLIGAALMAMLMQATVTLLQASTTAAARSATQLDLQGQARFAVRRIAQRIASTPLADLAPKASDQSSATWLAPALYQLETGSVAGTLRLTETIGVTSRTLAEPVTSFSITSTAASGTPLVDVALTMRSDERPVSVSISARLGGAL